MKKLLYMLLFSLVLILCFVCLKNEWGRKLYAKANYGIEALIRKGEIENLFIGSSMFRQGIDIFSLEETIGNDSFILAFDGNQPAFEYLELKYLIDNGVKIRRLYLDMYAYSVASTPNVSDTRLLIQTDTKFKCEIWKMLSLYGNTNLSVLWEMFVTANNESLLTFPISYKLTNPLYYKGGNVQKNNGSTLSELSLLQIPHVRDNKINDLQRVNLINIIELCKNNMIELNFIETPKWYIVNDDNDYIELMEEYVLFLDENGISYYLSQNTAEKLNMSIERIVPFDSQIPEYFIDLVHMSSLGRTLFTTNLFNNHNNK